MSVKLEAGNWYRNRDGKIFYCIGESKAMMSGGDSWLVEDEMGSNECFYANGRFVDYEENKRDLTEHLPDCDGFDWVPPKRPDAPEGWRWLEDDEKIQDGDCYWGKKYSDKEFIDDKASFYIGQTWVRLKHLMPHTWGVLREVNPPAPKYRPFANREEAFPFCDGWWLDDGDPVRIARVSNDYVFVGGRAYSFDMAFASLKRPDGTLFGVLDQ